MGKHLSFILLTLLMLGIPYQGYSQQYNAADKEGLRKIFRQGNNYKIMRLTTSDTLTWYTSEDWVRKLDDIMWENGRLTGIGIIGEIEGKFDCSPFTYLTSLFLARTKITELDISKNINLIDLSFVFNPISIDFSKNINLESLNCYGNSLKTLDISKNINLKQLYCSENNLTSLDLSNNINLEMLNCVQNSLETLNISKNINLINLLCDNNNLSYLDLTNNVKLQTISCSANSLKTLDLSKNTKLNQLFCNNNYFKFSTLPNLLNFKRISYSPQKKIQGGVVGHFQIIDLSSEYNINGNITTYEWYDANNQIVNLFSQGNGKFIAGDTSLIGKKLTCKMTNSSLPDLTLEYEVIITQSNAKDNPNNLKIINGKIISKTYASSTSPAIFPNPVVDIFTIQTSEKVDVIEIYSLSGNFIKKVENQNQINIQELKTGVYMARIVIKGNQYKKKIIKK